MQKRNVSKDDYDVIVVGAGMGGLSAATHLSVAGMKVLLLEQHYKVGGCTTSFERGEFKFDVALHEMSLGGGEKGIVRNVLEKAGIFDRIELIPVKPMGRSIFPDFEFVHPASEPKMKEALKARWPKEAKNIDRFHELLFVLADEVAELHSLYLGNPIKSLFAKIAIPIKQPNLFHYRNKTVSEVLDEFFDDKNLIAAISQFWAYHGPPPSKQWSLIYMIAHHSYLLNGGWQIKGSSQALSDAYQERILETGGKVLTDTLVTKILMKNDRVSGVEVESGERYTARYVVSNADPYQTFFKLIGEDNIPKSYAKKIKSMKPSSSIAGVYLGLDVGADYWGIEDYEIFLNKSLDTDLMYNSMMSGDYENGLISVTVYSNLGDPFYAPEGKGVVALHTFSDIATWAEAGEDYERQKAEMMDTLIGRLEQIMPGVRDHIEVKVGMTPRTMKSYTMQQAGAPYGFNFTVEQQERLAIPTPVGGLYLAGSWTWPAHSVGMAQVSGFLASQLIRKEENGEK